MSWYVGIILLSTCAGIYHLRQLETNNRGKMTPLLGYTIYRPGEGGNFADALTLADDLYGLSIAEVLGKSGSTIGSIID